MKLILPKARPMKRDATVRHGTFLPRESWEKVSYWKLDNGWTALLSFGAYGETVGQLIPPEGKESPRRWQACNGLDNLPAFAREWVTPIATDHWMTVTRPNFVKRYHSNADCINLQPR